jgi:hypothetical protein
LICKTYRFGHFFASGDQISRIKNPHFILSISPNSSCNFLSIPLFRSQKYQFLVNLCKKAKFPKYGDLFGAGKGLHNITVDPATAANISHTQQPQNPTEHPHKPHTDLTQFSHSTLARALLTTLHHKSVLL